jgi:tripartite-type tricarboxylate transporter receptor subunit TctC
MIDSTHRLPAEPMRGDRHPAGLLARLAAVVRLMPLAGLALLVATPAPASDFPQRPIQLVAPYPAGGAADVLSRMLAKKLEAELGQPVVVENKPGAGTAIGAAAVANAKPDGYTLLLSSSSTYSLNPAIQPKLPYDPVNGFEAIGRVGTVALAVLVHPSVKATTIGELVALIRAEPAKYGYGSFGNGTVSHFAGEMLRSAAKLQYAHVPYRGSAPAMQDLIGGQIPISFDTLVATLPQLKAGKVRALAVTTARRSQLLPDLPTVTESGFPGYEIDSWIALVAPRGLPEAVATRLRQTLAKVMADPDTKRRMIDAGFEPRFEPLTNWGTVVAADIQRMKTIATQSNIKVD